MKTHRVIAVVLTVIVLGVISARAEDPVHIPDPALKAAVEAALGIPDPTSTDMLALELLHTPNQGITDLTGLEYATNLRFLNLQGNLIVDLSVLSTLTNLTELWFQRNQIADIGAIANLTNLTTLLVDDNEIVDIAAVSGLSNLERLAVGCNQITDVSVVWDLANLTYLDLRECTITDLSRAAELNDLTHLLLNGNQIDDISAVSGLTALEELWLQRNQITKIDAVAGLTNLTTLLLDDNQISDISAVASLTNLERLTLGRNQITDVSVVWDLTNLTYLNLSYCAINDLSPVARLKRLTDLFLNYNHITDISAISELPALQVLWLKGNQIDDVSPLADLPDLGQIDLAWNGLTDVSALTPMTSLDELWLSGNPLHPQACLIDIPLIKVNNPGVVIHYDGCVELPQALTISSTSGGAVVMPGEEVFTCLWGELVPVEAVADEGYQFTRWSGTAVDANAMLDPCSPHTSVFMDADHTLTAHFAPQEEPWSTVYFNDFEDAVGPEWSHDLVDATLIGERRFLGQFGNDSVTLTLADLPAHAEARVSFDLFVIRSWDGDGLPAPPGVGAGAGPDIWSLQVEDGPTLQQTTFDNHITEPYLGFHRQSYPQEYPYAESLPQTGAAETGTLGYVWPHPEGTAPADSVYHLDYRFAHAAPSIALILAASLTSPLNNESWGVDNVKVEVLTSEVELITSSTAGGAVITPGEGVSTYLMGEVVSVEAVAEKGHHFTHWSGGAVDAGKVADPNAAATTVLMDGGYTLMANFALDQRRLLIASTAGGSVTDPGEGSFTYNQGSSAAVQATAQAGYHFTHWSGSAVDAGKVADPNAAATTVLMDGGYTLTANFAIDTHTLTTSSTSGGSTTEPGEGAFTYTQGQLAAVEATAEEHYHFTGWSGTAVEAGKMADPAAAKTTVTMDGDYTLQANFAIEQHVLVVHAGEGGWVSVVAVRPDGSSLEAASNCTLNLDHGTKVVLVAMAQSGYEFENFASWSGDYYGTADYWEFTLERDWYLTAHFTAESAP